MDIISFNEAATANGRIEKFIRNPDSNSGIVTVPTVIGAGESVTIPAGRMAVLPNIQVDGTLNIEGEVFIPTGATFGDLENQIALKADTSYVNGKYSGFKNYIINGGFDIWQRGTSFKAFGYSADRWLFTPGAAGAVGTGSKVFGSLEKQKLGSPSFRVSITSAGRSTASISQKIEGLEKFSGKNLTLSFNLAGTLNGSAYLYLNYGSGGSPQEFISLGSCIQGASYERKTFTASIPELSAKTFGEGSFLWVYINTNNTITGEAYFGNIQLEEGSVATPFEQRPYGLELSLCKRYYCKSFGVNVTPSNASSSDTINDIANAITAFAPHRGRLISGVNTCSIPFGVEMRKAPAVQRYGNSSGYWYYNDTVTSGFTHNMFIMATTKGLIIGNELSTEYNVVAVGHYTADAEL